MRSAKQTSVKEEEKPTGNEIKEALELFDANGDGKINAREIRGAMQNIGFDEKLYMKLLLN